MKKPATRLIPRLAAGIAPATAVTTSLMCPLALGAPGDLDPGFGDVGRLGPILAGSAWSLLPQDDGSMLLSGGRHYPGFYYWGTYYAPQVSNFVSLLSATGQAESAFKAATLAGTQVLDIARQPDGQVVAVGGRIATNTTRLAAFRLQTGGSLDTTFANAGIFELPAALFGNKHIGTSVVLDDDGRIVIAGTRDARLIVIRLLPDGSLDVSFGTSGVFTGPDAFNFSTLESTVGRASILRTAAGGYRVTASNASGCHIVALTAAGALDNGFGTAGIAAVETASGPSTVCNSMVAHADGRMLVAGEAGGKGFARRVLADGQPDPGFAATAVSDTLSDATAVAVGADDSIIVAGRNISGETIMRLQANGELDVLFGNAGATLVDLTSEVPTAAVVRDMHVATDGSVLAAGGDSASGNAFVVRLLGAAGGDSPGVLGVADRTTIATEEGSNEVLVNIRRTGGASGTVSVAYRSDEFGWPPATAGQDFGAVSGRLTWADGDTTEQQIQIPILGGGPVEPDEYFQLTLRDIQGGAGLGTSSAFIKIAADGAPFGQIGFTETTYEVREAGPLTVNVSRDYYASGAVSITLTPVAGSATAGIDFVADPQVLSWADGETGWKSAKFAIIDDTKRENAESFSIELSNPTGGALLGLQSTATVWISKNDQPTPKSQGSGATGVWSLSLLGLMAMLRRRLWKPGFYRSKK